MKKSISKRIKVTGTGKIIKRHMAQGHNGTRKTTSQKRRGRATTQFFGADSKLIIKDMIRS
jgi:ribosomal protein L35